MVQRQDHQYQYCQCKHIMKHQSFQYPQTVNDFLSCVLVYHIHPDESVSHAS